MSMIFLAAILMAQTPAAVQPTAAAPVVKKQKPAQVCEYIEITGSRSRQRVCHDAGTAANLEEYGVSDSGFGKNAIGRAGTSGIGGASTGSSLPQ
jgi:hypothetical protein